MLGAVGVGRMAAVEGHTVVVMRVDHPVAQPESAGARAGKGVVC